MFILRIAGDVNGVKRNIEVTFPQRPSLQQVCTVAETILPLQGWGDHRPLRSPWAAATQGAGGDDPSTAGPSRAPANAKSRAAVPAVSYAVESLVYLDRATRQWDELYSASQLTSGTQVYCFFFLQYYRVAAAQGKRSSSAFPSSSSVFPVGKEHVSDSASPSLPVHGGLPLGAGVPQNWVDPDCPGAIPEPQQRLLWDGASGTRGRVNQRAQGLDGGFNRAESAFPSLTQASAQSRGDVAHGFAARLCPTPASSSVSFHGHCFPFLFPSRTVPFSGSAWSGLSPVAGAASRSMDKANSPSLFSAPTFTPPRQAVAGFMRSASLPTRKEHNSIVEAQGRKPSPLRRHSTSSRLRDERYTSLSKLIPDWSALLLSGEEGHGGRYFRLSDRLAFLFDVLVHLDPQEDGAGQRQYILLRDFYLLASRFTSTCPSAAALPRSSYAAMGVRDTPVQSTILNITAELDEQLHWTWDDVVRHADKDRDGCIAYREWISFGIEHPEVIQLLCRAVYVLLLREAASPMGCYPDIPTSPSAQTLLLALPGHLLSHSTSSRSGRGDRACNNGVMPFSNFPKFCRGHNSQMNGRHAGKSWVMRVAEAHELRSTRCEACRELHAELSEDCCSKASAQTNFVFSLRR
nr:unnamed protein product [Leishmania braziliensis]